MAEPIIRYLVDTNIWLYAAANIREAVKFFDEAETAQWIGYSGITRLEVFGYPKLRQEDESKLTEFLGCFEEVSVSGDIIDRAIILRKEHRIHVPDAIIAATAIAYRATLTTRNTRDFKGIRGLKVLDPFSERH